MRPFESLLTRLLPSISGVGALAIAWLASVPPAVAAPAVRGQLDPFRYCARVGTIDAPEGGATPIPSALEPFVRRLLGLAADAPLAAGSAYWRCMDGAVYVCATGANVPCSAKANLATRNPAADDYCRSNPAATDVPAYVTGHDRIYDWRCSAGTAVHGPPTVTLDRQGYRTDIWQRVIAP